eukprot:32133-Chlamydomonas_euryale.AAC.2
MPPFPPLLASRPHLLGLERRHAVLRHWHLRSGSISIGISSVSASVSTASAGASSPPAAAASARLAVSISSMAGMSMNTSSGLSSVSISSVSRFTSMSSSTRTKGQHQHQHQQRHPQGHARLKCGRTPDKAKPSHVPSTDRHHVHDSSRGLLPTTSRDAALKAGSWEPCACRALGLLKCTRVYE